MSPSIFPRAHLLWIAMSPPPSISWCMQSDHVAYIALPSLGLLGGSRDKNLLEVSHSHPLTQHNITSPTRGSENVCYREGVLSQ